MNKTLFNSKIFAWKNKINAIRPILILPFLVAICLLFPACTVNKTQSLKELTHPYINQYVCTKAQFGETNLLNGIQEIRLTFLDKESGELLVITSDGTRTTTKFPYTLNEETGELTAEIGIFGYRFHESVTIQNGNFTLAHNINGTPLLLHFEVK